MADVAHGALWPGRGLAAWQFAGDVYAWLAGGIAVFADCSLLLIAANVCLFMLAYLQLHDICTWYDAVNVHDIVYVYAHVAEYVYDIVYVYVNVYVFALLFMWHMMKFGHWWQHISCQLDNQSNVYVCVYVNNVLQIWFSFSDFIFWFGFFIFIFWFENLKSNIDKLIFVCYNPTRKSKLIFTGGIHNG